MTEIEIEAEISRRARIEIERNETSLNSVAMWVALTLITANFFFLAITTTRFGEILQSLRMDCRWPTRFILSLGHAGPIMTLFLLGIVFLLSALRARKWMLGLIVFLSAALCFEALSLCAPFASTFSNSPMRKK